MSGEYANPAKDVRRQAAGRCDRSYREHRYRAGRDRPIGARRGFVTCGSLRDTSCPWRLKICMTISDQFEQRFAEMLTHYPTKRSVLIPTLLYAQDEVGYLSEEVIEEIAQRLDLTELEVRNVISYYSMLTTKPRGKYNVQVCTNIACLLRGGEELLEHCETKLGIGHKGTTADGLFSLEEVECIGACSWAPAAQVNYDFHENLTVDKLDRVLGAYAKKGAA